MRADSVRLIEVWCSIAVMNTSKVWGGQSPQDRSSSRRESLLSAAEALLGDGGAVAVTMRAVVRAAQLSPRYFYESFASREELLFAVHDRVEDQLLQRLQNVSSSGDLRDAVRSSFEIIRDFFEEDPRRARILLREPLADDMLRSHSATPYPHLHPSRHSASRTGSSGGRRGYRRRRSGLDDQIHGALGA